MHLFLADPLEEPDGRLNQGVSDKVYEGPDGPRGGYQVQLELLQSNSANYQSKWNFSKVRELDHTMEGIPDLPLVKIKDLEELDKILRIFRYMRNVFSNALMSLFSMQGQKGKRKYSETTM